MKPKVLFPGWRMSPTGERRRFERAEDVPPGWFREGDVDDPRVGGGVSPAAEVPVAPPVESVPPAPGSAVLTQTREVLPDVPKGTCPMCGKHVPRGIAMHMKHCRGAA